MDPFDDASKKLADDPDTSRKVVRALGGTLSGQFADFQRITDQVAPLARLAESVKLFDSASARIPTDWAKGDGALYR